MKSLKKLTLATAVAIAPLSVNALEALDDDFLSDVTGQEGITIDREYRNTIEEFKYIDGDGDGSVGANAGEISVTDIRTGNFVDAKSLDITDFDAASAPGSLDFISYVGHKIDAAENGVLITRGQLGEVANVVVNDGVDSGYIEVETDRTLSTWNTAPAGATMQHSYGGTGFLGGGAPRTDQFGYMKSEMSGATLAAGQLMQGLTGNSVIDGDNYAVINDQILLQMNGAIFQNIAADAAVQPAIVTTMVFTGAVADAAEGAQTMADLVSPDPLVSGAAAQKVFTAISDADAGVAAAAGVPAGSITAAGSGLGPGGSNIYNADGGTIGLQKGNAISAGAIVANGGLTDVVAKMRTYADGRDTFIGGISIGGDGGQNSIGSVALLNQSNFATSARILQSNVRWGIGGNTIQMLNNNANRFIEGQTRISSKTDGSTGVHIKTEGGGSIQAIVYTDTDGGDQADGTAGNQMGILGFNSFRVATENSLDSDMNNSTGTYLRGKLTEFDLDVEDGKVVQSNMKVQGNLVLDRIFIGSIENATNKFNPKNIIGGVAIVGNVWEGKRSVYAH